MRVVFADTFYWVALANPEDARDADALALDDDLVTVEIVTTDEVLAEFLTFFSADGWQRARAAATVRQLLESPGVRVIPQSRHE